jgi:hypothetical protein
MPNSKKIFEQSQNMLYFVKFISDTPEDFDDLLFACDEDQIKTQVTVQSLYYLSEAFLPPHTLSISFERHLKLIPYFNLSLIH